MKKTRDKLKTTRIYYGHNPATGERLYWTVKVRDATKFITIDGTLLDAIRGHAGTTIGCHLSNCAMRNAAVFPHPCKFVAFTRSTALVVTQITRGQPVSAVKYEHSYGKWVERNDKDITKSFIKEHPEVVEREFRLRPPRAMKLFRSPPHHAETGETNHQKRAVVPRGALLRAQDAGLVTTGLTNMGFE